MPIWPMTQLAQTNFGGGRGSFGRRLISRRTRGLDGDSASEAIGRNSPSRFTGEQLTIHKLSRVEIFTIACLQPSTLSELLGQSSSSSGTCASSSEPFEFPSANAKLAQPPCVSLRCI